VVLALLYVLALMCAVQVDKMFTVAVIQPDVIADEKLDLILEKVSFYIYT